MLQGGIPVALLADLLGVVGASLFPGFDRRATSGSDSPRS